MHLTFTRASSGFRAFRFQAERDRLLACRAWKGKDLPVGRKAFFRDIIDLVASRTFDFHI
jgi:hypothetical protein